MVHLAAPEPLTLEFGAKRFIKVVGCLFNPIEGGVKQPDQLLAIWAILLVSGWLFDIHLLLDLSMEERSFDIKRV